MAIDRRGFLRGLALAPAAISACATGGAAPGAGAPAAAGRAATAEGDDARRPGAGLDAVRDFPLPASAGPAFTFRAAVLGSGGR